MNYPVDWLPDAEAELTEIWLNAPDRAAITQASKAVDFILQTDPVNAGESRSGGRRILFALPLAVIFRFDEAKSRAQVLHVWRFGKT